MSKVHRMYRHSWWRLSKEITTRDRQAMCNFADEDISFETLAEHFCCTKARINEEIVLTESYGYRLRIKQDMNESVKMDNYQVRQWLREVFVKMDKAKEEARRQKKDWDSLFAQELGTDYTFLSDEEKHEIITWAENIPDGYEPVVTFK